MIVDSSAVVAILRQEPMAPACARAMREAAVRKISAGNLFEASIVVDRYRNPVFSRRFDDFLATSGLVVEPFTAEHARIAREAYRDFGKGSGHPAQLNLGDCFAYALARATGEPLLYVGNDFARTGIASALDRGDQV